LVIDRRDGADQEALKNNLAAKLAEGSFMVATTGVFSAAVLKSYGLVLIIGNQRAVMLFEGSQLSNFEKCVLTIGDNTYNCVEQAFQHTKAKLVKNATDDSDKRALTDTLASYIMDTQAPEYMVKISRQIPMDDAVTAKWRKINIDVLETIVVKKMEVMPEIKTFIKTIAAAAAVVFENIEIWECNKHCDHYGVKMDLEAALKTTSDGTNYVSPDDAAVFNYGAARNHMGRILGIALQNKPSGISAETQEEIVKLQRESAATDDTDADEPSSKRSRSN
jgi:predicted NAD-dependent protein-ADP-ribosyltransferase YbiA (DUF1768 family)